MFSCLIYLWRFLCWQMYSFYCTFPLLNMKSNGMLWQVFLKGHYAYPPCKDRLLLRHRLCGDDALLHSVEGQWRTGDFCPSIKLKRETCAIWITGCHDNSGSSDLKCVVYRFVGSSLSFVFGSFFVIREPFLRVGGGQRGGLWGNM